MSEPAPAAEKARDPFVRLVETMQRLRGPDGCPWDREQDHASISLNLIEEAYETVDAIDRQDDADLKEELGDLLLQVVFHAEIARGEGRFDIGGVIEELVDKLIARHPHVFAGRSAADGPPDAAAVLANWEAIKRQQKGRQSLHEGIPPGLPALVYAHKVLR
ncbi:MAG: MazG family protein, partial [Actinomycetota bacterium]